MSRLNASTPSDFRFRQGDQPNTQAMKLELLREWIIEQIEALSEDDDPPVVLDETDYERIRTWWDAAPSANQTLLIWPFADQVTIPGNFTDAVGFLGGAVASPVEIEVYKDPVFTAGVITGGTVIGTITIATDGSYTFATVDGADYLFEINDTLACKWPNVTEANANSGAFVIKALFGESDSFFLLLVGDQQSGDDVLLLDGDQQSDGDDALLLEGG